MGNACRLIGAQLSSDPPDSRGYRSRRGITPSVSRIHTNTRGEAVAAYIQDSSQEATVARGETRPICNDLSDTRREQAAYDHELVAR